MPERVFWLLLAGLMAACSAQDAAPRTVALLAPFEGRYREVGYDALYAARMALREAGAMDIALLPLDDGGSPARAAERLRALEHDSRTRVALLAGPEATAPESLAALETLTALVIGEWGAEPAAGIFVLSHAELADKVAFSPRARVSALRGPPWPASATDNLALAQTLALYPGLAELEILSSAPLADADFTRRYRQDAPFAGKPGLLAPLAHDAMRIAISAARGASRQDARKIIGSNVFQGFSGEIRFRAGYRVAAPLYRYTLGKILGGPGQARSAPGLKAAPRAARRRY